VGDYVEPPTAITVDYSDTEINEVGAQSVDDYSIAAESVIEEEEEPTESPTESPTPGYDSTDNADDDVSVQSVEDDDEMDRAMEYEDTKQYEPTEEDNIVAAESVSDKTDPPTVFVRLEQSEFVKTVAFGYSSIVVILCVHVMYFYIRERPTYQVLPTNTNKKMKYASTSILD